MPYDGVAFHPREEETLSTSHLVLLQKQGQNKTVWAAWLYADLKRKEYYISSASHVYYLQVWIHVSTETNHKISLEI